MVENALYYTLSTISQTLAGALAVMVAFVLLKLPVIDGAITQARLYLRNWETIRPIEETWPILINEGVQGLAASDFGRTVGDAFRDQHRRLLEDGVVAWKRRPWITRLLYTGLAASAITIAFCGVALARIPSYVNSPPWPGRILVVSVTLLIVCLTLYAGLIVAIIGRRPE